MPAVNFETPQVITNTVASIKVTGIVNDAENEKVEIHYITFLADGSPYQRGNIVINGYDAVKATYAEIDAEIAKGKGFEDASREVLYKKVLVG